MFSKRTTTALFAAATLLTWHSTLSAGVEIHENALRSIIPRATSGLFSGPTGNYRYTAYISWTATQNPTDMTSTVTAHFYLEKTTERENRSWNTENPPSKIYIGNVLVHSGKHNYDFPENCPVGTRADLGSGTTTVSHDECGARSVEISATFDSTGTTFGVFTVEGTAELDLIPVYTTVKYDATGGSVSPSTVNVRYCGVYENLAQPRKEGFTFAGWYSTAGNDGKLLDGTKVSNKNGHTIYAHWTINNYVIKFVSEGATIKEETLPYNTNINFPAENPKKTGHTFAGWCENEIPYTGTTVPAHSLTLYAKFTINNYVIKFVSEGTTVKEETLPYNSNINFPAENPKKTGHTFAGWYIDEGLVTEYTETTVPAHNLTLYAKFTKFTINNYTTKFIVDDVTVKEETLPYNSNINFPTENPTKEGYTFAYWCENETIGEEYTGTTVPAYNLTLYPKFTPNKYTVTFECAEGISCPPITDDFMSSIADFVPEREGYTFAGWYIDEGLETEYTETTIPAKNITLYPKFTINYYTVKFVSDDGTVKEEVVPFNTTINYPAENPKKEGYAFNGWDSKPERVGAENVTIRAVWVEITNEYVEIVFKKGGMSEEDIKAIINKYTGDSSFTIEKFEENDEGKTTAIIKFVDSSTIEGFSRKVIVSENDNIDSVKYNSKSSSSLAGGLLYPLSLHALVFA